MSWSRFCGQTYVYNDKVIGVTRGLGGQYIIAHYSLQGRKHRVRNHTKLGVYGTPDEAQRALDKFADENNLLSILRLKQNEQN